MLKKLKHGGHPLVSVEQEEHCVGHHLKTLNCLPVQERPVQPMSHQINLKSAVVWITSRMLPTAKGKHHPANQLTQSRPAPQDQS